MLVLIGCTLFSHGQPGVGLTNYRLPLEKKGVKVAAPFHLAITDPVLSIVEDTSGMFRIKGNALWLKKNKKIHRSTAAMVYTLKLTIVDRPLEVDLVVDRFLTNKVIAHRGAWKNNNVSQNSLGSLQKAIDLGCEGSEFDVWVSADGVAILSHDASIGGYEIENTPVSQLVKVPLKNNEFLPTLEEFLLLGKKQNRTNLVLEIKTSTKGVPAMLAAVDTIVETVSRLKMQGWVKYISFNHGALVHLRKSQPFADLSYLSGDKSVDLIRKDGLNGIDYHHQVFDKDAQLVTNAHALGLTVNVWTVNAADKLKHFLERGVDMITTDEPELLLKIIADLK